MAHDIRASLLDMLQAIDRALALTQGFDEEQFAGDERTQWAVFSQIVILGEAAGRLPREFYDANPETPWASIVGMRHRLVHGYDAVDWGRVWATIANDLEPLRSQLERLMPKEEE